MNDMLRAGLSTDGLADLHFLSQGAPDAASGGRVNPDHASFKFGTDAIGFTFLCLTKCLENNPHDSSPDGADNSEDSTHRTPAMCRVSAQHLVAVLTH